MEEEYKNELESVLKKSDDFQKLIDTFVADMSKNIDIYCKGNDVLIDAVYKGTSLEKEFRKNNSAIRLAMLMLSKAVTDSKKMASIESVVRATFEKAMTSEGSDHEN